MTAIPLLRCVILPRPWRNQRHIHRLELKLRLIRIRREICLRRLQEILVVAVGEVRLVVRAARFVSHARALRDHARQLQHVVKLAGEDHAGVRPLRAVAQVHLAEAFEQLHQLRVGLLQVLVVADDGAILGHQLTQFLPQTGRDSPCPGCS